MNIVLFETTNLTPHLETSLELVKLHLEKGDNVNYYFLGHSVVFNNFIALGRRYLFPFCLPENKGKSIVRSDKFHFVSLKKNEVMLNLSVPNFNNIDELKRYKYKKYNAGLSALSTLISYLKFSNPNLQENKLLLNSILLSGISIYEYCLKILKKETVDFVYLFNGRFANNRAILDAAIETNTNFLIHERGSSKLKYSIRKYMPHHREKIMDKINESWESTKNSIKYDIAHEFFKSRRTNIEKNQFIKNQLKDFLHYKNLPKHRLITYFTSSEYEIIAVGDIVKWDRWLNQFEAVKSLINIIRKFPEVELFIRIHPHLINQDKRDLEDWLNLDIPKNTKIILPEDPTDTYKLIEYSDIVITSNSTVGIESVYWGTPSICLGPSFYSKLDAVYLPKNIEELESLILCNSLEVNPDKSLPYGYFISTYGEKFKFYKPDTLNSGKFMGINLHNFGICGFLSSLWKMLTSKFI